jgi:tetratricopeptide (TPR) repeat protein
MTDPKATQASDVPPRPLLATSASPAATRRIDLDAPDETVALAGEAKLSLAPTVVGDGDATAATSAPAPSTSGSAATPSDGPAATREDGPDSSGPHGADGRSKSTAETLILDPAKPHATGAQGFVASPTETCAIEGDPAATVGGTVDPGVDGGKPVLGRGRGSTAASRFRVLRPHARGGLGEVFVARDTELNREVALKEIQDRYADDPHHRSRFEYEAEVTGGLEHPGIVPVYGLSHTADGRPFYAMRFIRGEGLDRAIKAFHSAGGLAHGQHGWEFRQLLQRFVEVCYTLAFAHSRGVIHRDIKPANIMLGPYGETLVVDWGLAKRLGLADVADGSEPLSGAAGSARATAETQPGSVHGTPAYMSPEQSLGKLHLLGPASDVYSLGATLYVLLTGRDPFGGGNISEVLNRVQHGEFPHPRVVNRAIPPPLEAICLKAMALNPDARYASARSLAEEIEHWMADEPVTAYEEPWQHRLSRWGRRHRTWTQAGAAALLVVAVVAVVSAVIVNASWRSEHAARVRENQQRLLTDRLRTERQERLQTMRTKGEDLFRQGQEALDRQEWRNAGLQVAQVLAMTRPEPELADLTARADRLRAETERRLAGQEAQRQARETYDRFQHRRDDALYHGTLLTGLDLAANLEATRIAAREALALYGMSQDSARTPDFARAASLTPQEQEEVKTGCYELLLVLADAEAMPGPARGPGDPRDRARRALAVLDRAAGLGARTRSYHTRRARYLEQFGDGRGARDESARGAAIEATDAVDLFLLGQQQYQQGLLDQAGRTFEQAMRLRPDHFWAEYFLAVCSLKADPPRPAEAKAHLTACLSRRPDFPWIYLLRGYAHGEHGEFADAESDFQQALELSRDDGVRYGVLVNRGGMRIRQGKPEAATADLAEAIRLKPDQYQAHANLGLASAGQKRWSEAIEQLDLAITRAPEQAALYRNRALVNLNRQDLDAALRDFEQAIRLTPGPSRSLAKDHAHRGRILHRRKRYEDALTAYDAALKLGLDDRELERLRAEALLALSRGTEAIAAFNRYLDPAAPDPDAYRRRGFERARMADSAGALADYTLALALDPNSPSTRARRGWVYLGEASKLALRDFDEAIQLDPNNGDLYNGRGYARVLLGDYRGAVADAEQALKLGVPGHELRARLALTYNAACIYAQAASKAAFTAEPDRRQPLAKDYQDRAVALIHQALDLLPPPARTPFLQQAAGDPALDPIRGYPRFTELERSAQHGK